MMRTITNSETGLHRLAIDDLLEGYVSWREECQSVRLAYDRWTASERGDRRLAYAVYIEALDREEHAALAYAHHVDRVSRIAT
jgi:hypothetical protein